MSVMFSRPRRLNATLDMAPLIDVVFQLLIFFMLSSSFITPNLPLVLPTVDVSVDPSEQAPTVVSVDEEKRIYINQSEVRMGKFEATLAEHLRDSEDKSIQFRMHEERPYREFVGLMNLARKAGATQLNIVYRDRKGGSKRDD